MSSLVGEIVIQFDGGNYEYMCIYKFNLRILSVNEVWNIIVCVV